MKKNMKRFITLTVFLFILTSCANADDKDSVDETNVPEEKDDSESAEKDKQEENDKKEESDKKEREEREEKEAQKHDEKDKQNDKSSVKSIQKNTGSKDDKEEKSFSDLEVTKDDLEIVQDDEETKDEDLKLKEIHGTATEGLDGIFFDDEKGYHVLHLQAGLSNYTGANIFKNKWVAFALPNGVRVPDVDDIPSGVVIVSLPDGHTGVAVKIPNIDGIDSKALFLELPLIGEPDDNDPNENLYLYNVDGNKHSSQLIGEINSTRRIDFTQLSETP